ncbi:hypothetical protein DFQ26_001883 [Actinomortierella ambigua]|nr:hypothetical protein DFQ26_001883 [Actinomortierella ambigua]
MTRCLNLVAIAAIATTTILSTFVHGLEVELTDKNGVIHKFKVDDTVCKEIPEGVTAVSGKTDAETCYLYKGSKCFSNTTEDVREFSGDTVQEFKEITRRPVTMK